MMGSAESWNTMGNCRSGDPERLFVTGAAQRDARTICRGCPVLKQCLAMALTQKIKFGVWGGMTERERRALLKARPEINSWSEFLDRVEAVRRAERRTVTASTNQDTEQSLASIVPLASPRRSIENGVENGTPSQPRMTEAA